MNKKDPPDLVCAHPFNEMIAMGLTTDGEMVFIINVPEINQQMIVGMGDFPDAANMLNEYIMHVAEDHLDGNVHHHDVQMPDEPSEPNDVIPVAVSGNKTVH